MPPLLMLRLMPPWKTSMACSRHQLDPILPAQVRRGTSFLVVVDSPEQYNKQLPSLMKKTSSWGDMTVDLSIYPSLNSVMMTSSHPLVKERLLVHL